MSGTVAVKGANGKAPYSTRDSILDAMIAGKLTEAKPDNPAESRCDACGRTDCRNHACLDENLLPPYCRPL